MVELGLAFEPGQLLIAGRAGSAESSLALALGFTLPVGQQTVPDAQLPGHLRATHTRLAGLLNSPRA